MAESVCGREASLAISRWGFGWRRHNVLEREWLRADAASSAAVLCLARICLAALFVTSGFEKFSAVGPFAAMMAQHGVPAAWLTPYLAILIEFFGGLVLLLGVQTRLLAVLFAVYTLVTALIGHPFWSMSGAAVRPNEINFYKNIGIIGGFLLLYVTGGGRYSLDGWFAARRHTSLW
jgi:putative oxidoreductase